jgi:hypothetical protein
MWRSTPLGIGATGSPGDGTIVSYGPQPKRKRPAKAIPAAITAPRIVSAKRLGKMMGSPHLLFKIVH